MKKQFLQLMMVLATLAFVPCQNIYSQNTENETKSTKTKTVATFDGMSLEVDKFADIRVLRYDLPDFDKLTLDQKKLVYYLSQAALCGRDIIYDQNYRHNLQIRRTLEAIWENYTGDKSSEDFKKFQTYTKRVWFSNGIHHHYSTKKIMPEFSERYFANLVNNTEKSNLPLAANQTPEQLIEMLVPILFNENIDGKRVNKDEGADKVLESANNNYGPGVTTAEAKAFYDAQKDPDDKTPISHGLNTQLVKDGDDLKEKLWFADGMYGDAIKKITYWLDKAVTVAENPEQEKALSLLSEYYKTGDLRTFDEYSIAWVADVNSTVDVINGFIEVYGDAIGYKGAFESVVSYKDFLASEQMKTLDQNVQWFEDNSSIMDEHKKEKVTGVSYKVITVAMEAGDAAPATPIGINLPNANWIRSNHGSKSVSLGNILQAYEDASGSKSLEEFAHDAEEIERSKKYGKLAGKLHTALHEVVGHASGKINPGVGTPKETLPGYSSTLEEARADLVALYFILDQKMIDLGLMESLDVGKAEYDGYIRNGMMLQLRRLDMGENLEEDHMRNRQLVASWVFEKGQSENIIEKIEKAGKTYFNINDYEKLRVLFGDLLREIQRIKSEGDTEAGKNLVENYGVKVDPDLHQEVLDRYAPFNIAPYSGFVQPILTPVMDGDNITDIEVKHETDFATQMLRYAKDYSFLPNEN